MSAPQGECGTCAEFDEDTLEQCPASKRPCGHHCNCSWIHDSCCWCGAVFGDPQELPEPDVQLCSTCFYSTAMLGDSPGVAIRVHLHTRQYDCRPSDIPKEP